MGQRTRLLQQLLVLLGLASGERGGGKHRRDGLPDQAERQSSSPLPAPIGSRRGDCLCCAHVARQPAHAAACVEACAQAVQVRENAQQEAGYGELSDAREQHVAQFAEEGTEKAQDGVTDHQRDRQRSRRRHLAQLVDELLDLARIESGEVALSLAALEPSRVLDGVADRIGPVAERRSVRVRIATRLEADASVTTMRADAERLGQALLNLAHNAVKYSSPGGEVRLSWGATDRSVRFLVADDGIGISAAHQARIFERFYKVDRSRAREEDPGPERASAGLGLAIVRHIAQAHGGSVGVESREGEGSTFWIEVPRGA